MLFCGIRFSCCHAQAQNPPISPASTEKINEKSIEKTPEKSERSAQPGLSATNEGEFAVLLPDVMSGGSDHFIKHWDATGRLSGTVGTHDASITAIAMTFVVDKNGKSSPLLISGGQGGQLKIWGIGEGATANTMPLKSVKAHEGGITALAVTTNGLLIATGGMDTYIRLWDRRTGKMLAEVKAHDEAVRSLKFTRDGSILVSGSDDRLIRVWKVGEQGQTLDYQSSILAHDSAITAITLSPDANSVASVSADGYLKLWQINGGSLQRHIHVNMHGVLAVAYSPDGKLVATGDGDGRIRLWNVKTGLATAFVGSHERGVCTLAWTPDGEMLISGGGDKTLRYWNVTTGHQIARIAAHDGTVQAIAILP